MMRAGFALEKRGSRRRATVTYALLSSAAILASGNAALAQNAPAPGGGPAVPPPALTYRAGIDLSETYTTNGNGLPASAGGNRSDWDTQVQLNLGAHDRSERFSGDIDYTLSYNLYAHNSSLDRLYQYLNALGQVEVIPDHLRVSARGFVDPVSISNLGGISASGHPVAGGADTGIRNTYGYSVTPDFSFRLGDFATSDTSITQGATFFVQPNGTSNVVVIPGATTPTNVISTSVSERLTSGTDFTRFYWDINGSGQRTLRKQGDITSWSAIADGKYAVTRDIAITGTGGYQSFHTTEKLIRNLDGIIVYGGVDVTTGDLHLSARAGRQYNSPSYTGEIDYKITARSQILGSLTDTITTPAQRLLGNLGQLGVDAGGTFYNTGLGSIASGVTGFNPGGLDGLAIDNSITRYRSAQISFTHDEERTQYRITGLWTLSDTVSAPVGNIPTHQTSWGGTAAYTYHFTEDLSGTLDGSYTVNDLQTTGSYGLLDAHAGVNYIFSPQMQFYGRVGYAHRSSALHGLSAASDSTSDTSITVGLHREFF